MGRDRKLLAIMLFGFILPGCTDQGTPPVDLDHKRLWESLDVHDYVLQQQRQCFCPDGGRTVEIVVLADTIVSVSALDSIQPPVPSGPYLSVEALFEYIVVARSSNAAAVEVTYNQQYGYPERIFVDWIAQAVDDEIAYVSSQFRSIRR